MLYNASNVNQWKRDGSRPRPLQDSTEMEIRYALRNQDEVKVCHNTTARINHGVFNTPNVIVRFHSTDIVTFLGNGAIRLNTGGYRTVTTKQRLNALLRHRGITITQKAFAWFVTCEHGTREFEDGMIVR